jgi:gamma-glutamyltranspeptidase
MKAKYVYGVHMPTVGILNTTIAGTETGSIERFAKYSALPWHDALKAGYKIKKLVLVELV